jgi:hypothetical protein
MPGSTNGARPSVIKELTSGFTALRDRAREGGTPMSNLQPEAPSPGEFQGYNKARCLMWCHEARARVFERLNKETAFIKDTSVEAVHVDNTKLADRVFLTAFDDEGRVVSGDTLYNDEPDQRLEVASEFDHDFTHMEVPPGSDLEKVVAREDGWVVNMEVVREYDVVDDRRKTQRAVVLAHLPDLMKRGEARGFLLGQDEPDEEADTE